MDYHKERFQDFSLMIYKKDVLYAVFPANVEEHIIFSHQGLTYGGLLTQDISFFDVLSIFNAIKEYFKQTGIVKVFIKSMPVFYHQLPANETAYIFLNDHAKIERRDKVFAIDYSNELLFHKTKLKHYRKGVRLGLTIKEEHLEGFWNDLLIPLLDEKHKSKPVHSLEEINRLKNSFPNSIKQFNVYLKDELLAGITIFENQTVVKSQYAATSVNGEKHRALDFLFISIIKHYKEVGKKYFSMGTVADSSELGYKQGLIKQKEELGCRIYIQDHFTITL